jgi:acetyl-CoA C-acetyltransferase
LGDRVGIVGVGYEGFRPAITDISTRELMFQAASKAYADAGVDPRKDIGSFICCTEDLWEGWSIADEMVPDQVGGARRPVCTVPGDGITGLGHAVMHIRSGVADVVSVEAHSKAADVLDKYAVENLATDPAFVRVPGANNDVLAGLEMSWFMKATGVTRLELSEAIRAGRKRGMKNDRACYATEIPTKEVSSSPAVSSPLLASDRAEFAEAGIVFVLASEAWIRKRRADAVYVNGIAWRSSTPWYEGGRVEEAGYARLAARAAMKQAGLKSLAGLDVLEVDDTYSYKLLQHLFSLGFTRKQAASSFQSEERRINPSGGALAAGNLLEATGSHRALEAVLQVRGDAGAGQVKGAKKALALSWRGNPTATGAVAVMSA